MGPRRVAYLDLTGSGNETAAHLAENGRITLMFRAFTGSPRILRVYGKGWVVLPKTSEWEETAALFPSHPGARRIIEVEVLEPGPEPTLPLSAGDGFDAVEIRRPVRLATGLRVTGVDPSGEEQSAPAADIIVWFNGPAARETAEERIRLLRRPGP